MPVTPGRRSARRGCRRPRTASYGSPPAAGGRGMGDPVDGKFRVIVTEDAGDTWQKVSPAGMPKAKDGEFGFAASGTCVETAGVKDAWIASGGTAARGVHS